MSTVNPNTRPTTETDESPMEFPRTPTEPARTDPHGGGGGDLTVEPEHATAAESHRRAGKRPNRRRESW